jgi:hypothetical protein
MCSGGYNAGASVTCDGNHQYIFGTLSLTDADELIGPLPRWTRRATTGLARPLLTAAATSEVAEDGSPFWLAATVVKASIVTFCGNSTGVGSLEVWPI